MGICQISLNIANEAASDTFPIFVLKKPDSAPDNSAKSCSASSFSPDPLLCVFCFDHLFVTRSTIFRHFRNFAKHPCHVVSVSPAVKDLIRTDGAAETAQTRRLWETAPRRRRATLIGSFSDSSCLSPATSWRSWTFPSGCHRARLRTFELSEIQMDSSPSGGNGSSGNFPGIILPEPQIS